MAWSAKPGQAYLSQDGICQIKSKLTNDIFRQEMLHVYEQKSSSRDDLVRRARSEMKILIQEMQQTIGNHSEVEALMVPLASQLETVRGKKKYGYLPKDIKSTVDEIVNQPERFPAVNDCYQVWWDLQCQIEDFYSEKERQRPPLSEQKEFRSIKNSVIHETENIRLSRATFEDKDIEPMAGHLVGGLRQVEYPSTVPQNLPWIHREPHQTSSRQYPSGEADINGPAKTLQAPAGIRSGRPDRGPQ